MESRQTIRTPLLEKHEKEDQKETEMHNLCHGMVNQSPPQPYQLQQPSRAPLNQNYPTLTPNQMQQVPITPSTPQTGVIPCAGCRAMLSYPIGALCVKCPMCATMTAVQPVGQITCSLCKTSLIYPAQVPYVSCTCGLVFSVNSSPPPAQSK